MSTSERVIRKGYIKHKVPAEGPVPATPEKDKVVLFPQPAMCPA